MIFGDGVGASPVRGPYCQLAGYFVWRWCVSTLEQLSWRRCLCGLKIGPPRRHRIQPVEGPVLDPLAKETCFQKGSKSGPLEIKSDPLEGPALVPFLAPSLPQICWSVYFKLKLIWSAAAAAEILNWEAIFARPLFRTFWGPKQGPSVSHCFLQFLWPRGLPRSLPRSVLF